MKKTKKILAMACAMLLTAALAVGGTLAYLTANTDVVTNTFTVGKVDITLDETDVDLYGIKDGETRVIRNDYKLIPGHSYTKDPIVHVAKESEQCWLFVKVTNDIAGIEDATKIADQMIANGWSAVAGATDVYAYGQIVDARTEAKNVKVFESFKISSTADVSTYAGKTITIDAYAIQADGFDTAAAAWAAAPASWT